MILVNIRRSGMEAVTPAQVASAAAGDWVVSRDTLDAGYADVLLAVRRNQVLGAYTVLGWERTDDGRVRFELADCEEYAGLVGGEAPVKWKRGQVNPVQYVETADVDPHRTGAAAPDKPATGRPRRGVHRVTIETKGLTDEAAARLHHVLVTTAAATGHLHHHRSTSLVREIKAAKEAADYEYRSYASPPPLRD